MKTITTKNAVLAEVQRYRFARLDLLIRSLPDSEQRQTIQQIRRSREVQLMKLASGIEVVSLARKKPAPLLGIARGIALHTFCCDETNHRTLLMSDDVNKYFPSLFRSGMPSGYYVDTSGDRPVLGFVRVDTGLDHIVRIRQHLRGVIEQHAGVPEFAAMAASGQFEITYLVPTATKAVAINSANSHRSNHQLHCRAVAVPLLLNLLAPLHIQSTFPDVAGF